MKKRYRGLYSCLACKKIMIYGEPMMIEDNKVASVAKNLGDPNFKRGPVTEEKMPLMTVHDCFPYGTKHIGVCLFAGLVEENESEENGDDCE